LWENPQRVIDEAAGKFADLNTGKNVGEWEENSIGSGDEF
jgi:hypothetical protein